MKFKPENDAYPFEDGRHGIYDGQLCFFGGGHKSTPAPAPQPVANYTLPNIIPQVQQGEQASLPANPTYGSFSWANQDPYSLGQMMALARGFNLPTGGMLPVSTGGSSSYFGGQPQIASPRTSYFGPQTSSYQSYAPQPTPTPQSSGGGMDWGSLLGGIAGGLLSFL